jgi:PD-(D/E)XK nuclease superfamily protein
MEPQLYTSSRLRVLRACLRLHYYRYVLGIRTPETEQMRFGTVGHRALEAWYRVWMDVDDQDPPAGTDEEDSEIYFERRREALACRLPAALAIIDAADISVWDRIKLSILIRAYDARWGAEDWDILAVEQEFRYQLGDHVIGGKIDAIIRDRRDGRVYVVEHKTTGVDASLGSAYWEKLTIDTQVSIYIDGAGMLGYDIAGCIYDVLKRPGHEPKLATPPEKREYTKGRGCKGCGGSGGGKAGIIQGRGVYIVAGPGEEQREIECTGCSGTGWLNDADGKPQAPRLHAKQRDTDETAEAFEERLVEEIAERPEDFLLRGPVVRLEHELPAMRQDLLDAIGVEQTGLTPRNPDACASYGTLCSFFSICAGRESIDNQELFPRGRTHPELEVAT